MYGIIKNTKIKDIMSKRLNILLHEYNVKNEDELANKLYNDAQTIPCLKCKKETKYEEIKFVNGDPFCENCAKG